jgi:hypothetical protein
MRRATAIELLLRPDWVSVKGKVTDGFSTQDALTISNSIRISAAN